MLTLPPLSPLLSARRLVSWVWSLQTEEGGGRKFHESCSVHTLSGETASPVQRPPYIRVTDYSLLIDVLEWGIVSLAWDRYGGYRYLFV